MTADHRSVLYVLGFGGHARSVADIAFAKGHRSLLFLDDNAAVGEEFAGFPAFRPADVHAAPGDVAFPAAGDNGRRQAQIEGAAWHFLTLVAPSATVGIHTTLGKATLVAHHAHIGPGASIGAGVIVNTGALIEHECFVDDFAHISIQSSVAGRCRIGRRVFLGAGSTVIDGISICDDAVVGAGATVIENIDSAGVYVGTPARRVSISN